MELLALALARHHAAQANRGDTLRCIRKTHDTGQSRQHTTQGNDGNLAEAARRKLDARGAVQLGVSRKTRVAHTVVLEVRERDVAVEGAEQVLRRNAMAGFVEVDRHELVRPVAHTLGTRWQIVRRSSS